ncbi:MAG: secretin N-terminal domain-containing protein [Deltaproteobacteria bacterium]
MKIPVLLLGVMLLFAVTVSAEERLITLDVKDMEIADVIRMIADQSDSNIIISRNVKGQVSLNLQEVTIDKALDSILKINSFGYYREGNIIMVCTTSELNQRDQLSQLYTRVFRLKYVKVADVKPLLTSLKSQRGTLEIEPRSNSIMVTDTHDNLAALEGAITEMDKANDTRVYKLNYAKPQELLKSLQSVVPEASGSILVDERTNSLLVTAPPLLLKTVDTLIGNWDRQVPQVLIEARIMEITLGKNRFTGINWQYADPSSKHLSLGVAGLPVPAGVNSLDAFKIGVLDTDKFQVAIQALEQDSDVNILSNPRIVTLDNTEAKILIGSSEPYDVFHYDSDGRVTDKEIKFMEVGIKLTVTPKISGDGFITMAIHPEVSSPRKGTVSNDELAVDTTEATTMMTVKDGNTVVLGGLIKDNKEEYVSKVPLLGDIPLLGNLFRNKSKARTKKEIVIFITPRIITGESSISIYDARRDDEMRKALSVSREEEMHKALNMPHYGGRSL